MSGFNEDAMCPVVIKECTDVPPVSEVFAPGASVTGSDMKLHCSSDGCKRHSVIVKWAVVIGVC